MWESWEWTHERSDSWWILVNYICALSQPSFLDAEKQRAHGSLGCCGFSLWNWMLRPFWKLHRRQMPTQFPLKHFSRVVSSLGHPPAVISDVLRPGVLTDAFGRQQGSKRDWVHFGTLKLGCMIIFPSETQADKENCFPSEETRCGLPWAEESISLRGPHCSWPCVCFASNLREPGWQRNCVVKL